MLLICLALISIQYKNKISQQQGVFLLNVKEICFPPDKKEP